MKRNRKISKRMSVVATNSMRFGTIILVFFVMVILNLLASSSCTQLMKDKGEKEREIAKLDEALQREATRWEEMKTPEKLEIALLRHGLSMKPPRADQPVRMDAKGMPRLGQLSLKKASQLGVGTENVRYVERNVRPSGGRANSRRDGRPRVRR